MNADSDEPAKTVYLRPESAFIFPWIRCSPSPGNRVHLPRNRCSPSTGAGNGRPGEVRGRAGCSHSLPSPSLVKTELPSSHATEHLLDVGSLSGRARASRIRLVTSRHSLLPASCPAPPWASLAVGLPGVRWQPCRNDSGLRRGREDRAVLGPERSWPTQATKPANREERSGPAIDQAKIRGFHVPHQKSTRG